MKSWIPSLAAGIASAFISVSASAGSAGSGEILVAPQLAVAGQGPVSATFLGADSAFAQMYFSWDSSAVGFFFGRGTAVGATFQESPQQSPVNPFGPGTDVTFAALFGTPGTSAAQLSATGASPAMTAFLTAPDMGNPGPGIAFNAGVVETPGGVLIGFNPSGASAPSSFGGFAVRISVSNVCVK